MILAALRRLIAKKAKSIKAASSLLSMQTRLGNPPQFFALSTSVAVQEISRVYVVQCGDVSGLDSVFISEVWYDTTLLSKKSRKAPVLMGSYIFRHVAVAFANFNAFNFAATIPTTCPADPRAVRHCYPVERRHLFEESEYRLKCH